MLPLHLGSSKRALGSPTGHIHDAPLIGGVALGDFMVVTRSGGRFPLKFIRNGGAARHERGGPGSAVVMPGPCHIVGYGSVAATL
jgi:hypothetical protein